MMCNCNSTLSINRCPIHKKDGEISKGNTYRVFIQEKKPTKVHVYFIFIIILE